MRACRVDANHAGIVDAYRARGYRVLSLARQGDGVPDLLVHRNDVGFRLVEVKTLKGKLRRQQEAFQAKGWPVTVIRSVDDIV
jgi:hypothetical protein